MGCSPALPPRGLMPVGVLEGVRGSDSQRWEEVLCAKKISLGIYLSLFFLLTFFWKVGTEELDDRMYFASGLICKFQYAVITLVESLCSIWWIPV